MGGESNKRFRWVNHAAGWQVARPRRPILRPDVFQQGVHRQAYHLERTAIPWSPPMGIASGETVIIPPLPSPRLPMVAEPHVVGRGVETIA